MPLVNSIFKVQYHHQTADHIVIIDTDGEEFEYKPPEHHDYIEGETLHIRVDRMNKNFEINRNDEIIGPVVESEFDIEKTIKTLPICEDLGIWNPVKMYGQKAAEALFPLHKDNDWKIVKIDYEALDIDTAQVFEQALNHLNEGRLRQGVSQLSKMMSENLYYPDFYRAMALASLSANETARALKYLETGLGICDLRLPDNLDEYVLPGRHSGNLIYLTLLSIKAHILKDSGKQDEAISILNKTFKLNPWDQLGIRFLLHELTGNDYPLLKDAVSMDINPYLYIDAYDVKIRDTYDPEVKTNPDIWLNWDEAYRTYLIFHAHKGFFAQSKMKQQQMHEHIMLHNFVETMLASDDPPGSRREFARYVAGGHSRHEAIHIIGKHVMEQIAGYEKQKNKPLKNEK